MMGKPVIKGTRVTVELILRKLSEGAIEIDLLDAYPRLTKEDIQAAIRYGWKRKIKKIRVKGEPFSETVSKMRAEEA